MAKVNDKECAPGNGVLHRGEVGLQAMATKEYMGPQECTNTADSAGRTCSGSLGNEEPEYLSWQSELAAGIRDVDQLWQHLRLPPDQLAGARKAADLFPLLIPPAVLRRIKPGRMDDPILRQFLPVGIEAESQAGFTTDPVVEQGGDRRPAPGLIHQYLARVLLMTSPACAVNCRYCFRRHFPYQSLPKGRSWWTTAMDYIKSDSSIHELICSGGDPLMMPDSQWFQLLDECEAIGHLTTLRIHTRMPVVVPSRLTVELQQRLAASRLKVVMVLHANHPAEYDRAVTAALMPWRQTVTLLNQAVLLRGVNDSVEVQVDLAHAAFAAGVLPYYLHALDRVDGAAHYEVGPGDDCNIWQQMHERLPGYLLPRFVREEAGKAGKTWLR